MLQRELYRLVSGINQSIIKLSKNNSYYPPRINLNSEMSSKDMLVELGKLERFLQAPHFSYLVKDTDSDYRKR